MPNLVEDAQAEAEWQRVFKRILSFIDPLVGPESTPFYFMLAVGIGGSTHNVI